MFQENCSFKLFGPGFCGFDFLLSVETLSCLFTFNIADKKKRIGIIKSIIDQNITSADAPGC